MTITIAPRRVRMVGKRSGRARTRQRAGLAARDALAVLYIVLALGPVAFMLLMAVQDPVSIASGNLWPQHWNWSSFSTMWSTVDLSTGLKSSLIVSTATGLLSAPVALGAGYVIARHRFRGRQALRVSLLAAYVFPSVLLLLPLYVVFVVIQQTLHITIIGGYPALVITYLTLALPFSIWMMSIYIQNLPIEIEQAAAIDGASFFRTIRQVVLPLCRPALVVVFIFSFLHSWNDVLFASVLTNPGTHTLGVELQNFLADSLAIPQWNQLMAASIVSSVPALLLFLVVQRWVIAGLSAGATKG
jgi:ABC-type glycerol-3-phosphate transport system permease component